MRAGKYIEIRLSAADAETAGKRVDAMCDKLLANSVIEAYRFDIEGPGACLTRRATTPSSSARGAAGLMCAIEAGKRGRRVLVIERKPGGRTQDPDLGRRPVQLHQPVRLAGAVHLRKPELRPFRHGPLYARGLHRPRWSSTASPTTRRSSGSCSATAARRQVVDMLMAECRDAGVEVVTDCQVDGVSRPDESVLRMNPAALSALCRARATSRRSRWSWRRAGSRSRRWAPRTSACVWRSSSACR